MSSHQPTPFEARQSFSDRHRIETPEQVHLEFAIAGIGSRFLALAIDSVIQCGAFLIVGIILSVLGLTGLLQHWRLASLWLLAGVIAVFFVLYFGYFAAFEIFWDGQTPGKRVIGLRVIKETGRPLAVVESIGRNLMRIIDQAPGFYAIGMVTAMCNSQSKRLGDFVAGSLVIREQKMADIERAWIAAPAPASGDPLGDQLLSAEVLSPEDFELVNTFLVRRADLSPGLRHKFAFDILRRIRPKLGVSDLKGEGPEQTLEELAHRFRELRRD
jgi:uncharacterized RDD family membrane protein YckC